MWKLTNGRCVSWVVCWLSNHDSRSQDDGGIPGSIAADYPEEIPEVDADGRKLSKKEYKKLLKDRDAKLREKVRRLISSGMASLSESAYGSRQQLKRSCSARSKDSRYNYALGAPPCLSAVLI